MKNQFNRDLKLYALIFSIIVIISVGVLITVETYSQEEGSNSDTNLIPYAEPVGFLTQDVRTFPELDIKHQEFAKKISVEYESFGVKYARPILSDTNTIFLNENIMMLYFESGNQRETASMNNDYEKINNINSKYEKLINDTYKSFGYIDEYNKLSTDNQHLLDQKLEPIHNEIHQTVVSIYADMDIYTDILDQNIRDKYDKFGIKHDFADNLPDKDFDLLNEQVGKLFEKYDYNCSHYNIHATCKNTSDEFNVEYKVILDSFDIIDEYALLSTGKQYVLDQNIFLMYDEYEKNMEPFYAMIIQFNNLMSLT